MNFCYSHTVDVWDGSADTSWYNTSDTLFQITTAEQLAGLSIMVNNGTNFSGKTIEMMNDLDLGGELETPLNWVPIGNYYPNKFCFSGVFNGNNFIIENLYMQEFIADTLNVGLFGYINNAIIKNVTINNVFINLSSKSNCFLNSGVLVGECINSQLINCHIKAAYCYNCKGATGQISYSSISYSSFEGEIEGEGNGNAGISGTVRNSIVNNCISIGNIEGNRCAGGIAAISSNSRIYNTIFIGKCEVNDTYSGGIIGSSYYDTVENNFAITSQIGYGTNEYELYSLGGLFGIVSHSYINNCYITGGIINYPSYTGGIVGFGNEIKMQNCYAATFINEQEELRGSVAGVLDGYTIQNVFMDNNIGAFDGIGYGDNGVGEITNLFTTEITTGDSFGLQDNIGFYPSTWIYEEGLYPQLDIFANNADTLIQQASILSAIPIFLGEQVANQIKSDFTVSTLHGVSWSSSAEDIINIEGENAIVTPINQDTMVVLTVSLHNLKKEFYLKVLKGSDVKEPINNSLSLYPNPAITNLTLKNGEIAIQEISFYNIIGQQVKQIFVNSMQTTINIQDFPPGMYIAKINTEQGILTRKVQVIR